MLGTLFTVRVIGEMLRAAASRKGLLDDLENLRVG